MFEGGLTTTRGTAGRYLDRTLAASPLSLNTMASPIWFASLDAAAMATAAFSRVLKGLAEKSLQASVW